MSIDLETILEPAMLRRVWKGIKKREREVHLTQIPLVRDSAGGCAFDLNLGEILRNLQLRLLDGTYRPHSPIIIEVAKSKLLHRRLSFLTFEDGLILAALVHATSASLMNEMAEWVSFGRLDNSEKKPKGRRNITVDYEGWWTKWLRYRKLVKVIEGDTNPLLVVSDITNFFGSIDLSLMRSKISGQTSLDEKSNNLLFYLLENLRPVEVYGPSGSFGLPTVTDDTSRVLAHFYLAEFDQELMREGKEDKYTRWVDDMLISVSDSVEGGKVVARIERALSRLGLVANSSKTELVSKEAFRERHLEHENEYLDEIHEAVNTGGELSLEGFEEFEQKLIDFLSSPQKGHWSRILKRYYTQSRRVRSNILHTKWVDHLTEFPFNGASILDYVSFIPGNIEFCEQLFEYLKGQGTLFDDIQILLYETLLLKPFSNDSSLRGYVVDQVSCHFFGKNGFETPAGYVKGLQALTMYKFGGSRASDILAPSFAADSLENPMFATYGLPVLAVSDSHRRLAFEETEQIDDSRIQRIRTLIERLAIGDEKAIGVLLGLLKPKCTKYPKRLIINPRVLPLLRISLRCRNSETHKRIHNATDKIVSKMSGAGDSGLVDWVTVEHLRSVLASTSPRYTT